MTVSVSRQVPYRTGSFYFLPAEYAFLELSYHLVRKLKLLRVKGNPGPGANGS